MFEVLREVPLEQAIAVAHFAAKCLSHGKDLSPQGADLSVAERAIALRIKSEIEDAEHASIREMGVSRAERYIPALDETISDIVRRRPGFDPERGKRLLAELLRQPLNAQRRSEPDPAARGMFERGLDLLNAGQQARATVEIQRAIAIEPSYIAVLHNLITTSFGETRDWQRAITMLRFVIRLAPGYALAKDSLAVAFLNYGYEEAERGDPELATSIYSTALCFDAKPETLSHLRANMAAAFTRLGLRSFTEGDLEQSWKWMMRACDFHANDETRHNLGLAYARSGLSKLELGQPVDAIEFFERALDVGFVEPRLLNNYGTALAAVGQVDLAVLNFEKALDLAPEDAAILENLSKAQSHIRSQGGTLEPFRVEAPIDHYRELPFDPGQYPTAPVSILTPDYLPAA